MAHDICVTFQPKKTILNAKRKTVLLNSFGFLENLHYSSKYFISKTGKLPSNFLPFSNA